jgi:hypothetical protein
LWSCSWFINTPAIFPLLASCRCPCPCPCSCFFLFDLPLPRSCSCSFSCSPHSWEPPWYSLHPDISPLVLAPRWYN